MGDGPLALAKHVLRLIGILGKNEHEQLAFVNRVNELFSVVRTRHYVARRHPALHLALFEFVTDGVSDSLIL